ncbi:DUF1564 family protein [Leptospira langatensis]|uniref:DUF1564 family protein n=1 Tax=Leptospira langatensis TaxID=2484983 RepID=A0A5F1ZX32_9LEPT|nr:DUF1564 family protein [Leptospira langatensis]TGK01415.1 DUF1564 family protein [Leptospira langatensis]TGL42135.1 DUF1564 family protein [Leptospira langatensis]
MKLKLIENPKRTKSRSLKARSASNAMPVCTLLLPKNFHRKIRMEWKEDRAEASCLKDLLFLYSKEMEEKEKMNPHLNLLLYQRKRKETKVQWTRLNFRPDPGDWARLGLLARRHGVSRCYLFTFLLERYFAGNNRPDTSEKKKAA